jgi:hypothetical protein
MSGSVQAEPRLVVVSLTSMRSTDKPLPGDLVIRCREDREGVRRVVDVWVVTHWPDAEIIVGGPYQSYSYALQQARGLLKRQEQQPVWRDLARPGNSERLELVDDGTRESVRPLSQQHRSARTR